MSKKHLQRSVVQPQNNTVKSIKYINTKAAFQLETKLEGNEALVFISFKFIQNNFQCFSDWVKVEMNEYWAFNEMLHKMTWQDVYSTSRKQQKTGIAYTEISIKNYPDSTFKDSLSPDITTFELRVNQKIRVHGFRIKDIFFLCWLDRNHEITS